jgi:hypothetical protein
MDRFRTLLLNSTCAATAWCAAPTAPPPPLRITSPPPSPPPPAPAAGSRTHSLSMPNSSRCFVPLLPLRCPMQWVKDAQFELKRGIVCGPGLWRARVGAPTERRLPRVRVHQQRGRGRCRCRRRHRCRRGAGCRPPPFRVGPGRYRPKPYTLKPKTRSQNPKP